MVASPIGIGATGVLIEKVGLTYSLLGMGFLLTPLMYFIPKYSQFLNAKHEELPSFFSQHYPDTFKDNARN